MRQPWPEAFIRNITNAFGAAGTVWLEELPALIARCERAWQIRAHPPFKLSYNYVAPAVRADGTQVVLKICAPGIGLDSPASELTALRAYAGCGVAAVLGLLPEHNAVLLERIEPGTPLAEWVPKRDTEATAIAADVMRALWRATPDPELADLARWTHQLTEIRPAFFGGSGPFPEAMLARAEGLRGELLASAPAEVLLHGDLHHENILEGADGWRVIDPKGLRGDPAFECATFLRNPLGPADAPWFTQASIGRRVDMLVERLALDRQRVLGWAQVFAVLSPWWDMDPANPVLPASELAHFDRLLALS